MRRKENFMAAAQTASYQTSQQEIPTRETKPPADPSDMTRQNRDSQKIAQLAYSYWEAGGRRNGSAEEDWARAEQALYGDANAATK
jgi:hypothetical protein